MSKRAFNLVVYICVIIGFSGFGKSQDSSRLAHIKTQYNFTNWVGTTKTNYTFLATNWVPNFSSIGITNFILRDEGVWTNNRKESVYLFHPTSNLNVIIDCRIYEREGVTNAQDAMMEDFATCAAIQPFPSGASNGVNVGDRCYLGYPTNVNADIVFSRNNVFVTVLVDATNYSIKSIAEEMDNQIKNISTGN